MEGALDMSVSDQISGKITRFIQSIYQARELALKQLLINHLKRMPSHEEVRIHGRSVEYVAAQKIEYYWDDRYIGTISTESPTCITTTLPGEVHSVTVKGEIGLVP
jgi:hypothetical protein